MAKRAKPRPLSKAKLARERARARVGPVPPARLVPDKRRRPAKHKGKQLDDAV